MSVTEELALNEDVMIKMLEDILKHIEPVQWQMKTSWAIAHILCKNFNIKSENTEIVFPALIDLVKEYDKHKKNGMS